MEEITKKEMAKDIGLSPASAVDWTYELQKVCQAGIKKIYNTNQ